jgi:hypothetical protein
LFTHSLDLTIVCLVSQAPPRVRLPRQYEDGLLFEIGEVIRLKVSITGRPMPFVAWYHNGEEITSGGRVELTTTERNSLLRIADASRDDRGDYQIKVFNKIGEDVASCLVTVTGGCQGSGLTRTVPETRLGLFQIVPCLLGGQKSFKHLVRPSPCRGVHQKMTADVK